MRKRVKHPANLTMWEVWRYSKRDWFGYYLTLPLCALGRHTTHCLGHGCFDKQAVENAKRAEEQYKRRWNKADS